MYKRFILFLALLAGSSAQSQTPRLYVIPVLHNLHKVNKAYNYDSVKLLVARLHPDIIAVEIRKIDVDADSEYLSRNYPYEMRMMRYWFPNKKITGIDWLGNDIENKPIPPGYWTNLSPIKQYERALNAEPLRTAPCDSLQQQRLSLLKNLSLQDLLVSADARLTNAFYDCLYNGVKGSIHERVWQFYHLRNEKILENIRELMKASPNKVIVVLTGDDHYVYLKDKLPLTVLYK